MIGMGFLSFLTLLAISFVVAGIVHYGFRYRYLRGADGFLAKWVLGWIGAWIASPVLGYWFSGLAVGHQFVIPAFLGAFSAAFMTTAVCKTFAKIRRGDTAETTSIRDEIAPQAAQERRVA